MKQGYLCVLIFSGMVLMLLASACSVYSSILLKKDGSAEVITRPAFSYTPGSSYGSRNNNVNYQYKYFNHKEISGLTFVEDSTKIKFNIGKIDSLNNFLYCGFNKNFFRFNYRNDSLIFTDGNGEPLREEEKKMWNSCAFNTLITSERKIKSFYSNNSCAKLKGNTVYIRKEIRQYKKHKKNLKIILVFEQ